MAFENLPTEFAERVHKGFLRHARDKTSRGWRALLRQRRHSEHLRIARKLHDNWLQGFLSASMQLCLVSERLPPDSPPKPILCRALDLIRKGFDKGRGAQLGLRFPPLPDDSLAKALGDICDAFSSTSRTRMYIVILGETRPLVPAVQEQVHWIAREALLNALRHSAANRVEVEIQYLSRKLRVVVRDDGAGIDPQALRAGPNRHGGLTSMQERAASVGAEVRVWSKRGEGTEVEISLPILGKTA
jgi:signal transduction histidine kinase